MGAGIALLRVAKGRHFLSDVLIGGWMMALVVLCLFVLLRMGRHLKGFSLAAVLHDLRVWRRLFHRQVFDRKV